MGVPGWHSEQSVAKVLSAGQAWHLLPDDRVRIHHRSLNADPPVSMVFPVRFPVFHDTTDTRAESAGHMVFQRCQARQTKRCRDLGDTRHHGVRTACKQLGSVLLHMLRNQVRHRALVPKAAVVRSQPSTQIGGNHTIHLGHPVFARRSHQEYHVIPAISVEPGHEGERNQTDPSGDEQDTAGSGRDKGASERAEQVEAMTGRGGGHPAGAFSDGVVDHLYRSRIGVRAKCTEWAPKIGRLTRVGKDLDELSGAARPGNPRRAQSHQVDVSRNLLVDKDFGVFLEELRNHWTRASPGQAETP